MDEYLVNKIYRYDLRTYNTYKGKTLTEIKLFLNMDVKIAENINSFLARIDSNTRMKIENGIANNEIPKIKESNSYII